MTYQSFLLLIVIALMGAVVSAQDTPPIPTDLDASHISDDAVNDVANQLFCPVCENIPLDACGTAACNDWRDEIRGMLAVGMSDEAIIDNFVVRFGDRVVHSPRHPVIAALSLYVPWAMIVLALGLAVYSIMHWMAPHDPQTTETRPAPSTADPASGRRDSLLEQLEKDLVGD